jgi:hypothetical protein
MNIRMTTEFDTGEEIYRGQFGDWESAVRVLLTNNETQELNALTRIRDCGFLCADYVGRLHTRMIVGTNRSGHDVVVTFETVNGLTRCLPDGTPLDCGRD